MKSIPVLSLSIAVLSSALLFVHVALGITVFTTAGFLAILALDYSRRPRALSVATPARLTREQARSERLPLAG